MSFRASEVAGGVCYFLWERDYKGPCEIVNMHNGDRSGLDQRRLNEYDFCPP